MIILLSAIIILAIGLAVLARSMSDSGKIMTFEDCVNAPDSRLQESYPEVCVSKDGQRFVNPNQQSPCFRSGWESNPGACR